MKKLLTIITLALLLLAPINVMGNPPKNTGDARTKFYNFDEMLIDGEIKKPTGLYTDVRERARFERLLKLKKSFLRPLFDTALEKVFK